MAEYTADELGKQLIPLQRLSEALQCRICAQFFTGPVQLRCGHSFCSNCIRGNLEFKLRNHGADAQTCPDCRQPADEASLVVNYALREAVSAFKSLLPDLKSILQTVTAPPRKAAAASRPSNSHQGLHPNAIQNGSSAAKAVPGKLNHFHRQGKQAELQQLHSTQCQHLSGGENQQQAAAHQAHDHQTLTNANGNHSKKRQQQESIDNEVQIVEDDVAITDHPQNLHAAKRLKHSHDQQTRDGHGSDDVQPGTSTAEEVKAPEGFVTCPVCRVSVKPDLINDHLNVCLERSAKASNQKSKHPNKPPQKRSTLIQGSKIATQPVASIMNSTKPTAGFHTASATNGIRQRNHKAVTGSDVPPRIAHTLLKDKDLRAKLKALSLPPDGSKEDMVDRYLAYRRYIQSKVDEGTHMDLAQVRSSFLANYRQQLAARKSNPAMGSAFLSSNNHGPSTSTGMGISNTKHHANGPAQGDPRKSATPENGVEVLELEQDGVQATERILEQGRDEKSNAEVTAGLAGDRVPNNAPSASRPAKPLQPKQAANTQQPNSFSALIAGIKQRARRGSLSPVSSPRKPIATLPPATAVILKPATTTNAGVTEETQQPDGPHHLEADVKHAIPAAAVGVAGASINGNRPQSEQSPDDVQLGRDKHHTLHRHLQSSVQSAGDIGNGHMMGAPQQPQHLHHHRHSPPASGRHLQPGAQNQQPQGTLPTQRCDDTHVERGGTAAQLHLPSYELQPGYGHHDVHQTQCHTQLPSPLQPNFQQQQQQQQHMRQAMPTYQDIHVASYQPTQMTNSLPRHTTPDGRRIAPTQAQATSPFTPAMLSYTPSRHAGDAGTVMESVMSMYGNDDNNGDEWWEDEGDGVLDDIDMD